jgi:hypothetical protein
MRPSKRLELDRDAVVAFRDKFTALLADPHDKALQAELDTAAGPAGEIAGRTGAIIFYDPGGGQPHVPLNPFLAWSKVIYPDKYRLMPNDILGSANRLTGLLDAAVAKARERETGLVGLIARVIRFPADVREAAGLEPDTSAGRAAVGVAGFLELVLGGAVAAILAALLLRLF